MFCELFVQDDTSADEPFEWTLLNTPHSAERSCHSSLCNRTTCGEVEKVTRVRAEFWGLHSKSLVEHSVSGSAFRIARLRKTYETFLKLIYRCHIVMNGCVYQYGFRIIINGYFGSGVLFGSILHISSTTLYP